MSRISAASYVLSDSDSESAQRAVAEPSDDVDLHGLWQTEEHMGGVKSTNRLRRFRNGRCLTFSAQNQREKGVL